MTIAERLVLEMIANQLDDASVRIRKAAAVETPERQRFGYRADAFILATRALDDLDRLAANEMGHTGTPGYPVEVCAWCPAVLAMSPTKPESLSHGICKACDARLMKNVPASSSLTVRQ